MTPFAAFFCTPSSLFSLTGDVLFSKTLRPHLFRKDEKTKRQQEREEETGPVRINYGGHLEDGEKKKRKRGRRGRRKVGHKQQAVGARSVTLPTVQHDHVENPTHPVTACAPALLGDPAPLRRRHTYDQSWEEKSCFTTNYKIHTLKCHFLVDYSMKAWITPELSYSFSREPHNNPER